MKYFEAPSSICHSFLRVEKQAYVLSWQAQPLSSCGFSEANKKLGKLAIGDSSKQSSMDQ